jgi:hypothetical protein
MSGVSSMASHWVLQYFPDFVVHVHGGCAHFFVFSADIGASRVPGFVLWSGATANKMEKERDQGEDQQQMDHRGGHVKNQKSTEPKYEKDCKKNNEYRRSHDLCSPALSAIESRNSACWS